MAALSGLSGQSGLEFPNRSQVLTVLAQNGTIIYNGRHTMARGKFRQALVFTLFPFVRPLVLRANLQRRRATGGIRDVHLVLVVRKSVFFICFSFVVPAIFNDRLFVPSGFR